MRTPSARDLRKAISALMHGAGQTDDQAAVERVAEWLRLIEREQHIAERWGAPSVR